MLEAVFQGSNGRKKGFRGEKKGVKLISFKQGEKRVLKRRKKGFKEEKKGVKLISFKLEGRKSLKREKKGVDSLIKKGENILFFPTFKVLIKL